MSKTLVKTVHSEYLIDRKNKTLVRAPVHEDANDLSQFGLNGQPKNYVDLSIEDRVVARYSDGTYSVSTPVLSVEEVD